MGYLFLYYAVTGQTVRCGWITELKAEDGRLEVVFAEAPGLWVPFVGHDRFRVGLE